MLASSFNASFSAGPAYPPPVMVQRPSFLSRVFGGGQQTAVQQVPMYYPGRRFDVGSSLKYGALGGVAGGAVGGFSMLTKTALPFLGKVTTLAGVAKFAGAGAGIGIAASLLPVVLPGINRHPSLKAALTGASIGATAGAFLPIITPVGGAVLGAAAGVGLHLARRNRGNFSMSTGGYNQWNTYGAQGAWAGVGACRGRRSFPGGAYPGFPMQGPMGFPGQVPFAGSPYGGSLYGAGMGAYGTPYATPIQSGFGVLPQQQRRQIAIQDGNTRISVGSGKARKGNGKASGRKVAARSAAARTSNRAQARAAQQQQPVMFPGMNPALAAGMRPGMGGMPGQGMLAAQQGVLGMQRQPMVIAPNAMGSGMAGYRPVASFSVPTLPFNGPGLDQPLIQGLQNLPD